MSSIGSSKKPVVPPSSEMRRILNAHCLSGVTIQKYSRLEYCGSASPSAGRRFLSRFHGQTPLLSVHTAQSFSPAAIPLRARCFRLAVDPRQLVLEHAHVQLVIFEFAAIGGVAVVRHERDERRELQKILAVERPPQRKIQKHGKRLFPSLSWDAWLNTFFMQLAPCALSRLMLVLHFWRSISGRGLCIRLLNA